MIAVSLVVAACSPDDAGPNGSTSSTAEVISTGSKSSPATGVILVQDIAADGRPVRVLSPDGAELATLQPPADLPGPFDPVRVFAIPDTPHAILQTSNALVGLNLEDFSLAVLATDTEVMWVAPDRRHALVSFDGRLQALDVRTATLVPVAASAQPVAPQSAGDVIALTLASDETPSLLVDMATGAVTDVGRLAGPFLSDDGARFAVRRWLGALGSRQRQIAVAPVSDPSALEVWVQDAGDGHYVWGDTTLLGATAAGSVVTVDATGATEIGRIPVEGNTLPAPALYASPYGAGAVASVERTDGIAWYQIDPVRRETTELPEIADLDFSTTIAAPRGYLVLDDRGDEGPALTRAVALRLDDGAILEIVANEEPAVTPGGPISGRFIMTGLERDTPLRIVDLEDGSVTEIARGVRAVVSDDEAWFAVDMAAADDGSILEQTVAVVAAASDTPVEIARGRVVAWLHSTG